VSGSSVSGSGDTRLAYNISRQRPGQAMCNVYNNNISGLKAGLMWCSGNGWVDRSRLWQDITTREPRLCWPEMSTKTGWAEVAKRHPALADDNGPNWWKPVADPLSTTVATTCGESVGSSTQRYTSLGLKVAGLAPDKSISMFESIGRLGEP